MLWGFFGNLIFAIVARMLCGNHLKLTKNDITGKEFQTNLSRDLEKHGKCIFLFHIFPLEYFWAHTRLRPRLKPINFFSMAINLSYFSSIGLVFQVYFELLFVGFSMFQQARTQTFVGFVTRSSSSHKSIESFSKPRRRRARVSPNKRFNEQSNSCARAFRILVHFFAVLYKTTTWNDQILRCPENAKHER